VILLRNSWSTNLALMLRASYLVLWCMKFFNVGQQSCMITEIFSTGAEQRSDGGVIPGMSHSLKV